MKYTTALRACTTILALLLVSACASSPAVHYLVLSSVPSPSPMPLNVQLGRVAVPEYLEESRVWIRTDDHSLTPLPRVRWAEDLPRALTRRLNLQLGTGWSETRSQARLAIRFERFEAEFNLPPEPDRVVLHAYWHIEGVEETVPTQHEVKLISPLPDRHPNTLAATMGHLVVRMADIMEPALIPASNSVTGEAATEGNR